MKEQVRSVGIDIGTTTTQFVLSLLTLTNVAPGALVPRMAITGKEVLYRSAVHMTPIGSSDLVDSEAVFAIIQKEFANVGLSPADIATGAVIITGETAKKENARAISAAVAGLAGDFVVATAGGRLESIIAGKGSGAADYSRQHHCTVANIDIGGGTANIGIFASGEALDSCCINVGGRLLQLQPGSPIVTGISKPMSRILADEGLSLVAGERINLPSLIRICDRMCGVIIECLSTATPEGLAADLLMTEPLRHGYSIDAVMISGGVAEAVYGRQAWATIEDISRYGDIGPLFGGRLRHLWEGQAQPLVEPTETIRATVIGAGAQTVEVSGSTILVDEGMLPVKNVPVALVAGDVATMSGREIATAVGRAIDTYYDDGQVELLALGLRGNSYLNFAQIQELAQGISEGAKRLLTAGRPLIVVLQQDVGKVLGQSLRLLLGTGGLVCIDQLVVQEGDYVDIGRPMAGGAVVPVIIKSLVFETKQR